MEFQPGRLFYQVVLAAFRLQGATMTGWCEANGVKMQVARATCFGHMSGPVGRELLQRLVDAAGRSIVEALYRDQVRAEAQRVEKAVVGARR